MSIVSEISRISQNVADALDAVAAKGVTVPSGSNSDDLPGLIAQITGGGGSISIIDTEDSHGGIVRTIVADSAYYLQSKTNINPSTSSQLIEPDTGYNALSSVQINAMPSGTEGTPTAAKGTVSNNTITIIPSVTNVAGYISGGTKTGTGVTVSASELVSGSSTKTANGTYDVTNFETLIVAIPVYDGAMS